MSSLQSSYLVGQVFNSNIFYQNQRYVSSMKKSLFLLYTLSTHDILHKSTKKISVNKLLTSKLRANIHLPLLQYLKSCDISLYFLQ